MVRITGTTLLIELNQPDAEEFYQGLLNDIIVCVQALHETDMDEPLPGSMYYLLELYKGLLPDQEQINKMFGKKTT